MSEKGLILQAKKDISYFRTTRKSFWIIDSGGIGKAYILIASIRNSNAKIIEMTDVEELFEIYDYNISLKDLIQARVNYLKTL